MNTSKSLSSTWQEAWKTYATIANRFENSTIMKGNHPTSGDPVLDAFSSIGALRSTTYNKASLNEALARYLVPSFAFDPSLSAKLVYWLRAVREGAGERKTGLDGIRHLFLHFPDSATVFNMNALGELGYWKDVLHLAADPAPFAPAALEALAIAIGRKDRLACKWAPRFGTKHHKIAVQLRDILGMTNKQYRQHLKEHSATVEQHLCAKQFDQVNYSHVPSIASKRYSKAFKRQDDARYQAFLEDKTQKVNSSVLFPHEIVQPFVTDPHWMSPTERETVNSETARLLAEKQWASLPDLLADTDQSILTVTDVSGSMFSHGFGTTQTGPRPIDVSVGLSLYLANKLKGPFKNKFLTFSSTPALIDIDPDASLAEQCQAMVKADWGGSTNLIASLELILQTGVTLGIAQEDMPSTLLIISDMQFNGHRSHTDETTLQAVRARYSAAGYNAPNLVWWNVADYVGCPSAVHEANTALISGFSPRILNAVLTAQEVTPLQVMHEALDQIPIDVSMLPTHAQIAEAVLA